MTITKRIVMPNSLVILTVSLSLGVLAITIVGSAGVIIAHQNTEDLVMRSFSAIEAAKNDSRYTTMAEAIRTILNQKQGSMLHDKENIDVLVREVSKFRVA
jgi:hypothetical protein